MEGAHPTTRRPKWHAPPPKVLHLPRGPRKTKASPAITALQREKKERLEVLLEQERVFFRERTEGRGGAVEEERWRFQAEMLRAECDLLRMEREIAVRKMEGRKVQLERTLESTLHTLISVRRKISEGKNVNKLVEEEISHLMEKLETSPSRSRVKESLGTKRFNNFDNQVSSIRKQMDKDKHGGKLEEGARVREIREMAEVSFCAKDSSQVDDTLYSSCRSNVETIPKMEISLKRTEEEHARVLAPGSSFTFSSSLSSTLQDVSISLADQPCEESLFHNWKCSGHCKTIVQKIVEQVQVETEQWSQMQAMLGQVRDEMDELQTSRDFWEDRAVDSEYEIQSLHLMVKEWRQKALCSKVKVNELQEQISQLQEHIKRLRKGKDTEASRGRSVSREVETEKRVLIRLSKENGCKDNYACNHRSLSKRIDRKRPPLGDIRNSSSIH